jgi:hypothetical protein
MRHHNDNKMYEKIILKASYGKTPEKVEGMQFGEHQ